MSNRNRKHQSPQSGNNGANGAAPDNGGKRQEEKKTLTSRILHVRDTIRASKAGRLAWKGMKLLGVGGIAYASYKAGAKSVKPTTIYIREGVTEDEPEDEPIETPEPETEKEEE